MILGSPSKSYLAALHSDCFRRLILGEYRSSMLSLTVSLSMLGVGQRQPVNFQALYPNATDDGIDLLKRLLVVEPEQRIGADAALKHSFVNEYAITLDDSPMEVDVSTFDFGFESEVSRRRSPHR